MSVDVRRVMMIGEKRVVICKVWFAYSYGSADGDCYRVYVILIDVLEVFFIVDVRNLTEIFERDLRRVWDE